MSGFLLDTNVLSEFNRRGQPDRGVQHWLEAADPESLYVSVLTIGEIRQRVPNRQAQSEITQELL